MHSLDNLILSISSIIALWALSLFIIVRQQAQHEAQRKEWAEERKDLLDRIQAPTFAEYTNKVIKEKKLEQPPEEEEQNDPFIS